MLTKAQTIKLFEGYELLPNDENNETINKLLAYLDSEKEQHYWDGDQLVILQKEVIVYSCKRGLYHVDTALGNSTEHIFTYDELILEMNDTGDIK